MMRRSFLIAALLVPLASAAPRTEVATNVEFVSGNVKAIPPNTAGSLDTSNPSELSFHYNKSQFKVPYQSIVHTEVTEPSGHHLWRVPVPKIGKGARYLNISYREGESTRMLTFKASASAVADLSNSIGERRKSPNAEVATKVTKPAAAEKTPKAETAKAEKAPVASKKSEKSSKSTKSAKASKPETPAAPEKKAASVKADTEAWWGDTYWRTSRNKSKWPQVPSDNGAGVPAGTKE